MADEMDPERAERIRLAKEKAAAAKRAREAEAQSGTPAGPPGDTERASGAEHTGGAGKRSDDAPDDEKAKRIAAAKAKAAAAKAAAAKKRPAEWPYPASHKEPKPSTDLDAVRKEFADAVTGVGDMSGMPVVYVDPLRAFDVLRYARQELGFDHLPFVSACDYVEEGVLEVHWQLYAYPATAQHVGRDLVVKAHLPRDNAVVASVTGLWTGADWHERETYDLFGVRFEGHPELKRIFLPEGWRGHPLRKDYDRTPQYIGLGDDGEDVVYDTPGPGRW